jgi:hypothetical protein
VGREQRADKRGAAPTGPPTGPSVASPASAGGGRLRPENCTVVVPNSIVVRFCGPYPQECTGFTFAVPRLCNSPPVRQVSARRRRQRSRTCDFPGFDAVMCPHDGSTMSVAPAVGQPADSAGTHDEQDRLLTWGSRRSRPRSPALRRPPFPPLVARPSSPASPASHPSPSDNNRHPLHIDRVARHDERRVA